MPARHGADGAGRDDPTGVHYVHDVYDGQHIALAFDENGSLTNRYLHGPLIDQVLADEQVVDELVAADVLWALTDNLGSVRDLVDSDGEVVNHIDYDAYGRIAAETAAAISHAFGYTGRERDYESDLQYNRARYYDAAVGRWISEDPIGFKAGDANIARYVGNGPTNATDPSGLQFIDVNPYPVGVDSDPTPEQMADRLLEPPAGGGKDPFGRPVVPKYTPFGRTEGFADIDKCLWDEAERALPPTLPPIVMPGSVGSSGDLGRNRERRQQQEREREEALKKRDRDVLIKYFKLKRQQAHDALRDAYELRRQQMQVPCD